jgi:hypothetical protein
MDHEEVRTSPGWHHQMLMTMLAHCLLWPLKLRWGKKSSRADGGTAPDVMGGGLAPTALDDCRGPRVGRVGAAAQSPGLSSAPPAAPGGRGAASRGVGVASLTASAPCGDSASCRNPRPPLSASAEMLGSPTECAGAADAMSKGVCFTMKIIFVVKNRFHTPNFTCKISIPRATSSRYRTRCPRWSSHPLRTWGTEVQRRSESILSAPR